MYRPYVDIYITTGRMSLEAYTIQLWLQQHLPMPSRAKQEAESLV